MAQDPVAVPVLQVGEQHVVAVGIADPGVHAEECLWVRSQVEALGKVVRLVLRMASYQCGVLLALMEVERQPAVVVEYLRQPAETGVCRRVLGAHDGDGIGLDRLEQAEALAAFQHEVAQALAGHVDLVVRLGRRAQPPFADEATCPDVGGLAGQPQPPTGRPQVARCFLACSSSDRSAYSPCSAARPWMSSVNTGGASTSKYNSSSEPMSS